MLKIACTEEEASCLIPTLIAETQTPCPCSEKQGLFIRGLAYDGREVAITFTPGIMTIEGFSEAEIAVIRARRCPY